MSSIKNDKIKYLLQMLTLELGGSLWFSICFYFDQQRITSFWLAFEFGLISISILFIASFSLSICKLLTISSWRLSIAKTIDSFFFIKLFLLILNIIIFPITYFNVVGSFRHILIFIGATIVGCVWTIVKCIFRR